MPVPSYDELFNPLLQAIRELGGSASIPEQELKVAQLLNLTAEDVAEIHRGNTTKLSYRLAWARHYLKRFGLLQNSERGVWAFTPTGSKVTTVDPETVRRKVVALDREERKRKEITGNLFEEEEPDSWEEQLLEIVKNIPPAAFERLCQRLVRESGFIQVEVTGKTSDGGIDGKGVVRLGGILSFHVLFQCKRYKGSVSASIIRDFRGALIGRADKGLVVTTGTFTREARLEARRDGATPIDLIDGQELVEKLKAFGIGVSVKQKIIEEVMIDENFFQTL